jgi:hypothetical protein
MTFPTIEAAIDDGRIPEATREDYEVRMHKDPRGTKKVLAALPKAVHRDGDTEYPTAALSSRERKAVAAARKSPQAVHAEPGALSAPTASVEPQTGDDFDGDAYPPGWLNRRERETIAAASSGERRSRVTREAA